jgi:hypothetical protein
MNKPASLLDELRTQYEAARDSTNPHAEVEGFQPIGARMRLQRLQNPVVRW